DYNTALDRIRQKMAGGPNGQLTRQPLVFLFTAGYTGGDEIIYDRTTISETTEYKESHIPLFVLRLNKPELASRIKGVEDTQTADGSVSGAALDLTPDTLPKIEEKVRAI